MSVKTEVERIEAAKADIRAALIELGENVPIEETLSSYAAHVRNLKAKMANNT